MNSQVMYQGFILVAFIAIMYFMLIKPQRKREKEVDNMRNSIKTGDEIVTIGGICGKVVKVKDESVIIQVGADKTKFEIKKWAISSVENGSSVGTVSSNDTDDDAKAVKKSKPKRLGKKSAESMEDELKAAEEELKGGIDAPELPDTEAAVDAAEAAEELIEDINK